MNKYKITYRTYNNDIKAVIYRGWSISTWLSDINQCGVYDINDNMVIKIELISDALNENTQDLTEES